jgi:hypothetical protein
MNSIHRQNVWCDEALDLYHWRLLPTTVHGRIPTAIMAPMPPGGCRAGTDFSAKQAFLGCPTNACLASLVVAEFFSKTGKATFGNSA